MFTNHWKAAFPDSGKIADPDANLLTPTTRCPSVDACWRLQFQNRRTIVTWTARGEKWRVRLFEQSSRCVPSDLPVSSKTPRVTFACDSQPNVLSTLYFCRTLTLTLDVHVGAGGRSRG